VTGAPATNPQRGVTSAEEKMQGGGKHLPTKATAKSTASLVGVGMGGPATTAEYQILNPIPKIIIQ